MGAEMCIRDRDIRNCLAALSNEEPILTRLFQYRFSGGSGLEGHSFGNLFLSALTKITGSLEKAVQASSKVLAVQGQVLPTTNTDVMLWAELEDGEKIFGESKISQSKKVISRIGYLPENPSALPSACLLYTSPSPRDLSTSRMPSSA